MGLTTVMMKNPYPLYLYHKDHDEPIRVDSKEDESALVSQGWTRAYLYKEYPKVVYDPKDRSNCVTVQNKAQEDEAKVKFKEAAKRPILDKAVEIAKEHQSGEIDDNVTSNDDEIPSDPDDKSEQEIVVTKVTQEGGVENPEPVGKKPVISCDVCGEVFENAGQKGGHVRKTGHKKKG